MKQNSILLYVVVGMFVIAASAMAQNQFKLGVVDTQKVVEGYDAREGSERHAENRHRQTPCSVGQT